MTLNPYQGLKQCRALFSIGWKGSNDSESLSGIETRLRRLFRQTSQRSNDSESLSGIETG